MGAIGDYEDKKTFKLETRIQELENGIRTHAAQTENDRCWLDDIELYKLVGIEKHPGLDMPKDQFLKNCDQYWHCQQPIVEPPIEPFEPNWVSPPGDTIRDMLEEKKIPIEAFANGIGATVEFTEQLLAGVMCITPKLAQNLQALFGVPTRFWLNRELNYREGQYRLADPDLKKDDEDGHIR